MESAKPDIKYDEVDFDSAIDDFGDETVQFCVQAFLEKTYNELKVNIPILYKAENYKEIRGKMHILKTNSGYMGASNFQSLCKEFETCCKFESLNVKRIDELYPIFMLNLDKLYLKLKILYTEKFETEIKEEVELENKKEEDEDKIIDNKEEKEEKEENKEDEIKDNNIIIVENNENEIKDKFSEIKDNILATKENEQNIKNKEGKEEDNLDHNENNIIIKKNPIKRDLSLQQPKIAAIKINMMNMSNQNVNSNNNENEKSNVSSENSFNINDILKPKNYSCKNVIDLISLNEGKRHHQNQFYKNIFQSFRLTEEESKNKIVPKVRFSPRYTSESRKNKILNQLKLGFSTMDKSDIRDSLKRYDLSVLKNSATLVKENLIKFLNDEIPKIKVDLNYFLENHDLSKKKEVIEKINIIISNMKYLSDNYNTFFFRMIERLEICKDRKSFKSIIEKIINKLAMLEQELTIIYRVKIKRDDSLLKSLGYFQNDNVNKHSKKSLQNYTHSTYNMHRNKDNNSEQIEGLKKNLGMYNNKTKNSKKKLMHFPYSFKVQRLFVLDDIKNIKTSLSLKDVINKKGEDEEHLEENKEIENNQDKNENNISNKNISHDFNNDSLLCIESFKKAIKNRNKDELIQAINDFQSNLVDKYYFTNMEQNIDKWISKVKKAETFGDLNANIEDLEDIIDYMKKELENKNIEIDSEAESQENDDIFFNEEKQKKMHEEILDKEEMALFSQLKKFNPEAFFLPINPGFSQHKFKIKVEKMIRDLTSNSQEIIQNNYNSNYNFVEKASSHIILSQNFRTKKNQLIGFNYPFKEDTFLNNCNIV